MSNPTVILHPEAVWKSMKQLQPGLYSWALSIGARINEDISWEAMGTGIGYYSGYGYCGRCGTLQLSGGRFYPVSCCKEGYSLHLLPPVWIPDKLLVLTLELFDHCDKVQQVQATSDKRPS